MSRLPRHTRRRVAAGKAPRAMRGLSILQLMFVLGSLGIIAWLVLTYIQR